MFSLKLGAEKNCFLLSMPCSFGCHPPKQNVAVSTTSERQKFNISLCVLDCNETKNLFLFDEIFFMCPLLHYTDNYHLTCFNIYLCDKGNKHIEN